MILYFILAWILVTIDAPRPIWFVWGIGLIVELLVAIFSDK